MQQNYIVNQKKKLQVFEMLYSKYKHVFFKIKCTLTQKVIKSSKTTETQSYRTEIFNLLLQKPEF